MNVSLCYPFPVIDTQNPVPWATWSSENKLVWIRTSSCIRGFPSYAASVWQNNSGEYVYGCDFQGPEMAL